MTEEQYLLTVLAEECAEVAQRASKAVRFGMEEIQEGQPLTNRERVEQELADLMAIVELLGLVARNADIEAKKSKVETYLEYSRSLGMVRGASNP